MYKDMYGYDIYVRKSFIEFICTEMMISKKTIEFNKEMKDSQNLLNSINKEMKVSQDIGDPLIIQC